MEKFVNYQIYYDIFGNEYECWKIENNKAHFQSLTVSNYNITAPIKIYEDTECIYNDGDNELREDNYIFIAADYHLIGKYLYKDGYYA